MSTQTTPHTHPPPAQKQTLNIYNFIHIIIFTNENLFTWKYINLSSCNFCNELDIIDMELFVICILTCFVQLYAFYKLHI